MIERRGKRNVTDDPNALPIADKRNNDLPEEPSLDLNVSLPDELADFVRSQVDTGTYGSSGEVVREALRLMERANTQQLVFLRKAWQEGLDSGEAEELDFEALKAEGRARLAARKA